MANYPTNYAPVSRRSRVAHMPGQAPNEKIKEGRDYNFEFVDSNLTTKGWENPRAEGCKSVGLYRNRYSDNTEGKYPGGFKGEHIEPMSNITESWGGDRGFDKNPIVQTYTTSIFFGNAISGWQENNLYPNVGPDFSYIFITKIYTFDPRTDEFFITELLNPNDKVFERTLKQDMKWSNKFQVRLLDEGTEHDLKDEYNVHYNLGLFTNIATYQTCSDAPYSHPQLLSTQYAPHARKEFYGIPIRDYKTAHLTGSDGKALGYEAMTQNFVHFGWNSDSRDMITGSFTVEVNEDTYWWRRPQSSAFFKGSNPQNTPASSRFMGLTELTHLKSVNSATGSVYNFLYRLFRTEDSPAETDLHIITYNEAAGTSKAFQTEQRYARNTTQGLRHFGSLPLSSGRLMNMPGTYLANKATLATNNLAGKVVAPNFKAFTTHSYYYQSYETQSVYTYFNNDNADSFYVTPATSGDHPYLEASQSRFEADASKDAPWLNKWTISKLHKRPNVIMTDLNKIYDLYDGVGGKGFVLIHENLHPQIKNNLDYFLKKAELIDKGPNRNGVGSKHPRLFRTPVLKVGKWFDKLGK